MATNKKYTPSKARQWNRLICDAIHLVNFPPTIAARALAIVHTAMYDAWTNYNDGGCEVSTTTGSRLKQPDSDCTSENREKTYSHAAYTTAHALFWCLLPPEHKSMFRDFMCDCGYNPDDKNLEPDNAVGIGNLSGNTRTRMQAMAMAQTNTAPSMLAGYTDFLGLQPR